MTKEDFIKLPEQAQEDFINEGGSIEPSIPIQEKVEDMSPSGSRSFPDEKGEVISSLFSQPSPLSNLEGDVNAPSTIKVDTPRNTTEHSKVGADIFDGFIILNPVELLFLVDENISSGRVVLHDWQIQVMLDFAKGGVTDTFPYQALVQACNGSGKDKYIIAPCIVWLCMRYKKTITVVTSSSGAQLDNQTCRYIKQLAEDINRKFSVELWKTKYREYTLDFGDGSSSSVFCYATDEPKKAEGYHPTEFGAKMGLFVSEDKSVPDDINVAINKCTGYTHRMHVSTPGSMIGHFYDYSNTAVDRNEIEDITKINPIDWIKYYVPASRCSHLSANYFKQMERDLPGGKTGAAYKSQVDALFGTTDEMVVIPYTYVWYAMNKKSDSDWLIEPYNKAGLDLSDGGDETVLIVRNGNKVLKIIPFRFEDTQDTIEFLIEQFKENKLQHPEALIYADCGGLGKPMLDQLRRKGWKNIRYVDNRSTAQYPKTYKNRGSELFFHMRDLLEHRELILLKDDRLAKQLGSRYYKLVDGQIHQLLSKMEQKSKKYPSPDRADALNLAFWDYQSTWKSSDSTEEEKPFDEPEEESPKSTFDLRVQSQEHAKKYIANNGQKNFSLLESEIEDYNRRILTSK